MVSIPSVQEMGGTAWGRAARGAPPGHPAVGDAAGDKVEEAGVQWGFPPRG